MPHTIHYPCLLASLRTQYYARPGTPGFKPAFPAAPPPHTHLFQDDTIEVISGAAAYDFDNGRVTGELHGCFHRRCCRTGPVVTGLRTSPCGVHAGRREDHGPQRRGGVIVSRLAPLTVCARGITSGLLSLRRGRRHPSPGVVHVFWNPRAKDGEPMHFKFAHSPKGNSKAYFENFAGELPCCCAAAGGGGGRCRGRAPEGVVHATAVPEKLAADRETQCDPQQASRTITAASKRSRRCR